MKEEGGRRKEEAGKSIFLLALAFLFPLSSFLFFTFSFAQAPSESRTLKIIEADRLELRSEDKEELVILTGAPVRMTRGEEKIEAERIIYNKSRKSLKLLGNAFYLDKDGQEIRADEVDLDTSDDSFEAVEVRLKSGEFDLIGPLCQRAAGQILLEQGYFTSCLQCGHDVADYAFRAREVLLYPGDRIIAREVQILIRDTPVMYLPVMLLFLSERKPKLDVGFNSASGDGAFVIADLPFVSDFGIGYSLLRYWERRGWGFGMDLQGVAIAKTRYYFEFLPPTVADRKLNPAKLTGYLKYDFSYLLDTDEEWNIDASVRRNDQPSNTPGDPQVSQTRLTDIDFKISYKLGEPIYRFAVDTFVDHDSKTRTPLTTPQKKPELEVDFPQGYKAGGFSITGKAVLGLYEGSKNLNNPAAIAAPGSTIQSWRLLLEHNEGFSYNSSTAGAAKVGLPQGSQLKPLPKFADSPRYTPTANDKIVLNGFFDEREIAEFRTGTSIPADGFGESSNPQDPKVPKQPQIVLNVLNGTFSLPPGVPLAVEAERLEVDFSLGGDFKLGELSFLPGSPFVPPPGSADTLPEGSITVPPGSTLNLPEGSKVMVSYRLANLPLKEGSIIEIPRGSVFKSVINPNSRTLAAPIKYTVPGGSLIEPGGAPQTQPGQAQPTQPGQAQPTQPGQAAQGQASPAVQKQIPVTFEYTPEPGSTLELPAGANLIIPPIPPRPVWEGFTFSINNQFRGFYYTFQAQRQIQWNTNASANQILGPFTLGLSFTRNLTEGQNPFGNLDFLSNRPGPLLLDYNLGFKPDPGLNLTATGGYEYNYRGRTANDRRWQSKPLQLSLAVQPDPVFSLSASLTRNIELDGSKLLFEPLRFGLSFTPNPLNLNFNLERDLQNRVPIKSSLALGFNPAPLSFRLDTSYTWNKLKEIASGIPTYDPVSRYELTTINLGYNPPGSTISLNHLRDLNNGQAISTQLQINLRDEQDSYSISQTLTQPYFGSLGNPSNRFQLSGNAFAVLGPHNFSLSNTITFPEPLLSFNPDNGSADFGLGYSYNRPGNNTTIRLSWRDNFVEQCFTPGQRPQLVVSTLISDVDAFVDFDLAYRFGGCELIGNQTNGYDKRVQPDYLERASFKGGFTIWPSPASLEGGLGLAIQGALSAERRSSDGRFEIKLTDFGPTFSTLAPENTRIYFSTLFNAPIDGKSLNFPALPSDKFILKPRFILAVDRCCWSTRLTWDTVKGEFKWTLLLGGQAADFLWNKNGFQLPSTTQP